MLAIKMNAWNPIFYHLQFLFSAVVHLPNIISTFLTIYLFPYLFLQSSLIFYNQSLSYAVISTLAFEASKYGPYQVQTLSSIHCIEYQPVHPFNNPCVVFVIGVFPFDRRFLFSIKSLGRFCHLFASCTTYQLCL